jgi:twitching motility two-component system response regulator PilG
MQRPIAFVIEDQPSLNTLYEDALRLVGYDIIAVQDGLQALNTLEINEPPALIILDINLPRLSGRDIHKHIRKHARYDKTRVMILTANSVMANVIRPEITQNDHLFIKPISMKELQNFAKLMRPAEDGVPEHMTDTQKVPSLSELEDETIKDKDIVDILKPDETLTVNTQSKAEKKSKSQEHKAFITPNDEVDEPRAEISGEEISTVPSDAASDETTATQAENTEAIEIDKKAPTEKAAAKSDNEAESK